MRLSVIIPTRGGPAATRFLAGVAEQLGPDDELIVSIDGEQRSSSAAEHPRARFLTGPAGGPAVARNRALESATGDLVLFLNDDVQPRPGLLAAHGSAHDRAASAPVMVLGAAPWAIPDDDRVLDRLLRETSLVFFHDQMAGRDAAKDWGFRHAWTLNLSVPRSAAGRFDERLGYPMFDDLAWAHGLGLPVRYCPAAAVVHHHRYTARAVLRREALLGHQAFCLHRISPACAGDMFSDRYRAGRPPTGDQMRTAAESFSAFEHASSRAAGEATTAEVRELFEASRPWRETARAIGVAAAQRGVSVRDAEDSAEHGIARRPGIAVGATR